MDKNVNSCGIVICASEGGNLLTQSFPTIYHTFHSKVICKDDEDAARWTEVTEAEAEALMAKDTELQSYGIPDAAYLARVQKVFGMRWRKGPAGPDIYKNFVGYDADRGYFWFGSLQDVTKVDMDIALSAATEMHKMKHIEGCFLIPGLRFIALPYGSQYNYMLQNSTVEEIMLEGKLNDFVRFRDSNLRSFREADYLRKVNGIIMARDITASKEISFYRDSALEEIQIINLKCNAEFSSSANLSLESIRYVVFKAENTVPITITLHPDAYARVTDEIFALAAEKNITIATT